MAAIRAGGRLVTVGMGCDHARLPVSEMTFREVTLVGSFRYANTVRACRTPAVLPACMPVEKMQRCSSCSIFLHCPLWLLASPCGKAPVPAC